MSLYDVPIDSLRGIGKSRAKLFQKLNINSVYDLLRYYPRTYEDWSKVSYISELQNGETAVIKAHVTSNVTTPYTRNGKIISKVQISDDTGSLMLTFFNNKYISSMLKYGEEYYFFGKVSRDIYGFSMTSPEFSNTKTADSLVPVYPLTSGLTNRMVVKTVKTALSMLPKEIQEPIPKDIIDRYNLCSLRFALNNIHFPKDAESLEKARRRLVFEELLVLNLGMRMLKSRVSQSTPVKMPVDYSKEFISKLPFELTNSQKNAVVDCINDMKNKKSPMNRLIQGDVGSGKTAVAATVCYNCVKNGYQAAFMAPTEVLCEQHYKTFLKMFEGMGITVDLLTGSLTPSKKKKAREKLLSGETDIIIGTHALLTESTEFLNLGCAITDEQHRFGVNQRSKLAQKGEMPHILVLSATPIPRTLGLIIYGDLDITSITELPKGRKKIKTFVINSKKRNDALGFIKEEVKKGNQAYIVCPLVSEGELELESAENYAAELMLGPFSDCPVGILHGKMKPKEKENTMRLFSKKELSVLVSTTVIEVGVDVPSATVIMIENAERFGLSQLHQLRGRVGRSDEQSYCILVSDNGGEKTEKRLATMKNTTNGFVIADEDLRQRGPGDFFGSRQHGLPKLNIADFSDMQSLRESQSAANEIISNNPDLSGKELSSLRAEIKLLFSSVSNSTMN